MLLYNAQSFCQESDLEDLPSQLLLVVMARSNKGNL